jgi:hypothetical protein
MFQEGKLQYLGIIGLGLRIYILKACKQNKPSSFVYHHHHRFWPISRQMLFSPFNVYIQHQTTYTCLLPLALKTSTTMSSHRHKLLKDIKHQRKHNLRKKTWIPKMNAKKVGRNITTQ